MGKNLASRYPIALGDGNGDVSSMISDVPGYLLWGELWEKIEAPKPIHPGPVPTRRVLALTGGCSRGPHWHCSIQVPRYFAYSITNQSCCCLRTEVGDGKKTGLSSFPVLAAPPVACSFLFFLLTAGPRHLDVPHQKKHPRQNLRVDVPARQQATSMRHPASTS